MDPLPFAPYHLRESRVIDRRTFLAGMGGVLLAAPLVAEAQQAGKALRIGYLSPTVPNALEATNLRAFRDALGKLGHPDDARTVLEERYAEDRLERLPTLASDLVNLRLDVIMTFATPATLAMKASTATIPIVMVAVGDPLGVGIVSSLSRPGGNITGVTLNNVESAQKRFQFLKEAVPTLSRVAALANQLNPSFTALHLGQSRRAAERMGITVDPVELRAPDGLADAFATIMKMRADGVIVFPDATFLAHRERITQLVLQSRLPSAAEQSQFADAGCLLTYGSDLTDLYRQAARFVDKISKGAKPGDLPVEQPTNYRLVINLKTAKALGLTIPPSLLGRADEVIQ